MLPETSQDISDEDDEGSDNTPTVDLSRVCHHDRSHADPESFVRGGPTFTTFLLGDERIQIPLKADHYRPVSETSFKWHFAGVPMMALH